MSSTYLQPYINTFQEDGIVEGERTILGIRTFRRYRLTSKGANLLSEKALVSNEESVYVSYAWGGESEHLVDEMEKAFAERGIYILRDKKKMRYKDSIKEFEQGMGQGLCVILVISDKYLRSEHCMYELSEIEENRELRRHIFPIVLEDAHIYTASDRVAYIQYWDEKVVKLNQKIKQFDRMTNLANISAELDKVNRIRTKVDDLIDLLGDMNIRPEIIAAQGFSILIDAVESVLHGKLPEQKSGDKVD
jgi:hypothetical protein